MSGLFYKFQVLEFRPHIFTEYHVFIELYGIYVKCN